MHSTFFSHASLLAFCCCKTVVAVAVVAACLTYRFDIRSFGSADQAIEWAVDQINERPKSRTERDR